MHRLSLCLIARDEEDLLPACLASVAEVVDEMVVVDTGSRDATIRIAREAGAVVAEMPWSDDFSAPRNAALELATGRFILVLDADERLAPESRTRLRAAIEGASFDCGMVRLHNASQLDAAPSQVVAGATRMGPPIPLPRVLRRTPDLRYRGIVHESVSDWIAARGMRIARLDVDVIHLGAISGMREQRGKRERNLGLLRRRCALEPARITPHGYLALELISHGLLAEARDVVERSWALIHSQPPGISVLRLAVARSRLAIEDEAPERALDATEIAQRTEGAQPDLFFLRGRAHLLLAARATGARRLTQLASAETAFRAALSMGERGALRQYVAGSSSWASWNGIGEVMLSLERSGDALLAFRQALLLCPESPDAGLGEVEALLPSQPQQALARVARLLDTAPDGWLLAGVGARSLGTREDAVPLIAQALARRKNRFRSARRSELLARIARELDLDPS